jgi:hypothetical protein
MSTPYNSFIPAITGASVSGNFYDMKNHVEFDVDMVINTSHVLDSFVVDIDTSDKTTVNKHLRYQVNVPVNVTGNYNVSKTISSLYTGSDNIPYNFENHVLYKIQYIAIFRPSNVAAIDASANLVKTTHIQTFRYYANPVTLVSTFVASNDVSSGSVIDVSGVFLDLSGNEIDTTTPSHLTFTFQENDDEPGDTNNPTEPDDSYIVRKPYDPSGNYNLPSNTLSNGSSYNMSVNALWTLGYNTSKTSTQPIDVVNLPEIDEVEILPLYIRDTSDNVIKITLSQVNVPDETPNKLWFQFKNSDGTIVAEAGDASGNDYNPDNSYSFTLAQLIKKNGLSLVNGVAYNLVVKAKYDDVLSSPVYRYSQPVSVTFALSEPTISDITVNSLYLSDASANIATISVNNEAYELYAPYAAAGIEFVFYNVINNVSTEVARTSAYTFANTAGTGSTVTGSNTYPIKLTDVSGNLVHGIDYTVNAAVKVTNHAGATDYLVSSESKTVKFVLTEPTISDITVNSLYLSDVNEKIATISVNNEAYQLYAPYADDGIKFVFYNVINNVSTEVARTVPYNFVNTTGIGSNTYPIKLTDVSGNLVHGIEYTVKAAVNVTNHAGTTDYLVSSVSSESKTVTFVLSEPTISSISVNDLYLSDASANIATITVSDEAYQLYAPYADDGIKFVFHYGGQEVARTVPYNFVNTAGTGSNTYPIKLTDVSGNLENDIEYTVNAAVKVTDHAGTTEYLVSSVSSESKTVKFDLIRPTIDSISPYDVQNDGDNDDSASQIVATVSVQNSAYKLYAPYRTSGIKFVFYDVNESEIAKTDAYTFANADSSTLNLYNIQLNEINLNDSALYLTNGTPYKVKAEVRLTNHNGILDLRLSEYFTNVTFTQNIAPLPYVEISNTWALATNNNPETYRTSFIASPDIGISGNFKKTAQFGSQYSKQLDTTNTKFKLEYKVTNSSSVITTDWTPVKKAKLVLQGSSVSSESFEEAVERARSTAGTLLTVSSGEYANIPGSGLGTSQGDIVFYLPPNQEDPSGNAFNETDTVDIRVSVVDRSSPSIWGGQTTSSAVDDSMVVIKKIDVYNFTAGQASEPWNSVDESSNLRINIPVSWNSEYSYSVDVDYKYTSDVNVSYGTPIEFLKSANPSSVSFVVDPTQGTTLYYRVRYVVTNLNLGLTATTEGILTDKTVSNKFFPVSSDYTVLDSSYNTFNTNSESSITFDLSFNISPENRLDGVNVYFTSPSASATPPGSNIAKVRIGSYTKLNGGSKTITLLSATGGSLEIMDASGIIVTSDASWNNFTMANISFEAFRDARVTSTNAPYNPTSSTSNPVTSNYYVETGGVSTFGSTTNNNPIWNVPTLTAPSSDGDIILSGGVINMLADVSNHYIKWTMTESDTITNTPFTYDVKMMNNTKSNQVIHDTLNYNSTSNYVLAIDTSIDPSGNAAVAKYTVEITKVFNGTTSRPEKSPVDTVVFATIYVDTSNMAVAVTNVSNTENVNLTWNNVVITGNSVTDASGGVVESSSYENNIYAQYVKYTTSDTDEFNDRLDASGGLIEEFVSSATKKEYTLPVQTIGTLYKFVMYVEAQVKYTVNDTFLTPSLTSPFSPKSIPFAVPLTPTTDVSKYRVSSVPSLGLLPDTSNNIVPVLIQNESNPHLLLNLDAKGLEDEGFISVVIILTQDGTDDKPEGEQVFLVFPDSGSTFSFNTSVVTNTNPTNPPTDIRLGGGDSATSIPRNLSNTVLSTDPSNNSYELTIGTANYTGPNTGRYGLSTLSMPASVNSGFVSDSIVNYMVILTTRRGTDVGVGEFTYQAIPSVQNVSIVQTNGQYYVQFGISNV